MKKNWLYICFFLMPLVARNPFFLPKKRVIKNPASVQIEHMQKKHEIESRTQAIERSRYILKGTIIGAKSIACIRYNERDNFLCVGNVIGVYTVIGIECGKVKLRYADGVVEILQLADKNKAGGK